MNETCTFPDIPSKNSHFLAFCAPFDAAFPAFDPQLILNHRGCRFPKRQKPFLHPEALEWLVIQNSNA